MSENVVGLFRHVNPVVSDIPISDNSDMSMPLKTLVSRRLAELGRSIPEATEKGKLSRTYIYDLLDGPEDRHIRGRLLEKLARALDLTPAELVAQSIGIEPASGAATEPAKTLPADKSSSEIALSTLAPPVPSLLPKDVPIYGTAMGSVFDRQEGFLFEGGAIDYARRPPALASIKDLYAIYVVNDSMWPMHPAGEIRFVNPHRPAQIGSSVIVQTRAHENDPGQAYIKLLRKRTTDKLVLEQFNPQMIIEIPTRFVVSVHHVYTMNEMFGV